MSAWPLTSCTCAVASFTICTSIDSFRPGAEAAEAEAEAAAACLPQPTWTLALSLSDPPFHVTTAVFVRPLFGDGVPFEHVQRSLYVVVHASFVRSPCRSSRPRRRRRRRSAGVPTSVGAAHWIVAVSGAELSEPHDAVAVLFGTSSPA